MKSIFRLIFLLLMLSGWAVAALSVYVIRTPDPNDPKASKLIVVPKNRLDYNETYVDARTWTMADVPNHRMIVMRVLEADKSAEMQYLADPKSKKDIRTQLRDAVSGSADDAGGKADATQRVSVRSAGFFH